MLVEVEGQLARASPPRTSCWRSSAHRHRRRHRLRHRVRRQRHPRAVDGRPHDGLQHGDRGGRARRHGRVDDDHDRLPQGPPAGPPGRATGTGGRLLAHAASPTGRALRPGRRARRRRDPPAGHLGHLARDGRADRRSRARSRSTKRIRCAARAWSARWCTWASTPTPRSPRSASTRCSSARAPTRASRTCAAAAVVKGRRKADPRQACAGRAGLRAGQAQAEAEGPRQGLPRRRVRMARAGLLDVPGDERRPLEPGERCASTSNRNFEGARARAGVRTWSAPPWRPLRRLPGISSTCARSERPKEILMTMKQCPLAIAICPCSSPAATPCQGPRQGHQEGRRGHREGRRQEVSEVMDKFTAATAHDGLVAPLDRANVDTDAIIPKQFLKSIKRTGFGPNLFDEWRYLDTGRARHGQQPPPLNPDFVLNQPRYRARASCSRARTSAAARPASTRPGRCWITASGSSSPRPSPTSSSTTASRTACCRSCCRLPPKSTACSRKSRRTRATADDRPAGAEGDHARTAGLRIRDRPLPQGMPRQRLGRHRPDAAPRRQDSRLRGAPPGSPRLCRAVTSGLSIFSLGQAGKRWPRVNR
jgi:hypothetical protein